MTPGDEKVMKLKKGFRHVVSVVSLVPVVCVVSVVSALSADSSLRRSPGVRVAAQSVTIRSLQIIAVWGFGFVVQYIWNSQSPLGEKLTWFTSFEVAGFAFLVLGEATYGAVIHFPRSRSVNDMQHATSYSLS